MPDAAQQRLIPPGTTAIADVKQPVCQPRIVRVEPPIALREEVLMPCMWLVHTDRAHARATGMLEHRDFPRQTLLCGVKIGRVAGEVVMQAELMA